MVREYSIPIVVVVLLSLGIAVFLFFRRQVDNSEKSGARRNTPEAIQGAIQQLLDATPSGDTGGYVIFQGPRDC